MTELPSLGGAFAEANAINASGQMVGSATYPGQPNNRLPRAVMWDADGIHDLGTLGGLSARAWAINQRGETVGAAQTADGAMHAVLWRDGVAHDLGTLGGRNSVALDINERGDVVGVSMTDTSDQFGPVTHGFLARRGGAMEDLTP